jgi:PPK2 family polyphosphate:nucleotide phosphotransferase
VSPSNASLKYATLVAEPGARIDLDDHDPADDGALTEEKAERLLRPLTEELRELQELLFAAATHGVLVVLQGMDAAGKDVTIQNVFAAANPEAIRVKHFTKLTEDEGAHGFLWRAHAAAPARGELVIFDRSYYEQLVNPLVDGEDDSGPGSQDERVADVRAFEAILDHAGILVVKVFLHVSNAEQERRLRERMEDPTTAWKISASDWIARRSWDRYMRAYEEVIAATATARAPWILVPADHQWFHNLAVAEALVTCLGRHRDEWVAARERVGQEKRAEAEAEAPRDR